MRLVLPINSTRFIINIADSISQTKRCFDNVPWICYRIIMLRFYEASNDSIMLRFYEASTDSMSA
jgi:hypothetical protein